MMRRLSCWGLLFSIWFGSSLLQAQTDSISLHFDRISLGEALIRIEQLTDYRFFYSNDRVQLDRILSADFKDVKLELILDKFFKGSSVKYRINGKQILLTPARNKLFRSSRSSFTATNGSSAKPEGKPVAGLYGSDLAVIGKVFDLQTKNPLPGVSILIEGSNRGTASLADGSFEIRRKTSEKILIFSCIGYQTRKVELKWLNSLEIGLEADLKPLEEVVVIGYGELRKGDLTGAISSIAGDEIRKLPVAGLDLAMQGKVPGLFITSSSGRPGAPASVKLRGVGTINNAEPLYVIDGIPFVHEVAPWIENNPLNLINPADIESIEVLKDASATAIYGSRGANGIIMVNTLRGKKMEGTRVAFSTYQGISVLRKKMNMLDNNAYLQLLDSMYLYGGEDAVPLPAAYTLPENRIRNNNWQDLVTQNASIRNYLFNISGGGERHNFYVSTGYLGQEGIMRGTGYQRFSFSANSDLQLGRVRIGESLHICQLGQQIELNSLGNALESAPIMPVYDALNRGGYAGPSEETTGNNNSTNVLAENLLREKENTVGRIFGGAYLSYSIAPWLTFQTNLSGDYSVNNSHEYIPVYDLGSAGKQSIRGNSVSKLYQNSVRKPIWIVENTLRLNEHIRQHEFNLVLGHSAQAYFSRGLSASANNVDSPDEVIIHSDRAGVMVEEDLQEWRLLSYLGRLNYAYKDRYLLTTSIRVDGSSRFSKDHRFAWFPSISAGWKVSEEEFFNSDLITFMKVRAGWGISGNQEIGNYGYASEIYTNRSYSVFGNNQVTFFGGSPLLQFGNKSIYWESNTQSDIGIDVGIFENKLLFTADYYHRVTNGMLVRVPLSGLSGYLQGFAEPYLNVGSILNKGMEYSLSWRKSWNKLGITLNANATTIKNKVLDLDGNSIIGGLNGETLTQAGYPLGSFWGYRTDGLFQDESEVLGHAIQTVGRNDTHPGDVRFRDVDIDGTITSEDRAYIGKSIPDLLYGGTIEASFDNFDLSILMQGIQGVEIYNETRRRLQSPGNLPYSIDRNKLAEALNYWRTDNTNTTISRLTTEDKNGNSRISDRWIDDGSYLRIREIELGYTFPRRVEKLLHAKNIRLYVSLQNFFTFTSYPGFDPEFGPISPAGYGGEPLQLNNIDSSTYPQYKSVMAGFQIQF